MAEIIVELLAFAVVVYVLWRYVRPPVRQMIRDRQEVIQEQVDASEEASQRLTDAHRRFEQAEDEARKEVAKLRDDARDDAVRISAELREQADREIERVRQRGQEQLAAHRDQMARGLRAEIGAAAMQQAEKQIKDALQEDRQRSATVDRFLDELDGMHPRSGSQPGAPVAAGGGAG